MNSEKGNKTQKALSAAALGNIIEWFDYGVYSFAAVTVGMHFFPAESATAAALASFAVFALSFLVRPIGGLVIGWLGDRHGRRDMLMLTVGLMTLGTVMIGLLPTYEQIGLLAPILLIFARMIQGFSAGGEYGGANIFMAEVAPVNQRGFFASILEAGVLFGFLGGAAVVVGMMHFMSDAAWNDWGWRIPFLLSLPLGLIALLLRKNLSDSPVFENMKKQGLEAKSPIKDAFRRSPRAMVITLAVIAFANSAYYLILAYLPSYLQTELKMSSDSALLLSVLVMGSMMIAVPFFGRVGDRYGRRPLLAASATLYLLLAVQVVSLLNSGNQTTVYLTAILAGLALAPYAASSCAALTILFPRSSRFTAFTLAYNTSTALFGGTAPFIVGWLTQETGNPYMIAYYQMAMAAIGLIGIAMMPETNKVSADHDGELKETESSSVSNAKV